MMEFTEYTILLFMLNTECRGFTPRLFTLCLVKARDELVHYTGFELHLCGLVYVTKFSHFFLQLMYILCHYHLFFQSIPSIYTSLEENPIFLSLYHLVI